MVLYNNICFALGGEWGHYTVNCHLVTLFRSSNRKRRIIYRIVMGLRLVVVPVLLSVGLNSLILFLNSKNMIKREPHEWVSSIVETKPRFSMKP